MAQWLIALLTPTVVTSALLLLAATAALVYRRGPDMVDARSRRRATKAALKAKTKAERDTALRVLEQLAPAERPTRRPPLHTGTSDAAASVDERGAPP